MKTTKELFSNKPLKCPLTSGHSVWSQWTKRFINSTLNKKKNQQQCNQRNYARELIRWMLEKVQCLNFKRSKQTKTKTWNTIRSIPGNTTEVFWKIFQSSHKIAGRKTKNSKQLKEKEKEKGNPDHFEIITCWLVCKYSGMIWAIITSKIKVDKYNK